MGGRDPARAAVNSLGPFPVINIFREQWHKVPGEHQQAAAKSGVSPCLYFYLKPA